MSETRQEQLKNAILKLKKEKGAVILAHYYVGGEVQEIADYVGDSYYLSKLAVELKEDTIIFCGVSFMGESAKVLNPDKRVILVDESADCPMAHMAQIEKIEQVRRQHPGIAVVCYVNSTAQLKAHSDVCVTSSNAVKVVKNLEQKEIFFIPDENLGRHVAGQVPEKKIIFNDGFCPVHVEIGTEELMAVKREHPGVKVLTHPECREDVLSLSDFIGSTSQIIDYATESQDEEFIICTETGVFYELQQKNPNKKFYSVVRQQICPDMKKITLEKVKMVLETLGPELEVDREMAEKSCKPLERMLELAEG